MADSAQHQRLQHQTGPVTTRPVSTAEAKQGNTTTSSTVAVRNVASVTISPATSNQNLKFDGEFEKVFKPSSLRHAFKTHAEFGSVFEQNLEDEDEDEYDFDLEIRRSMMASCGPKKSPGTIVALSEDLAPAAGGVKKSAGAATGAAAEDKFALTATSKGLVSAIMTAYSRHCDLVLSPDDVWLTILAQFCAYVNNNAEGLRDRIVAHEGKKELTAYSTGTLETANYQDMILLLLTDMRGNIKSPELADWFRPGFSTTTKKDEVCAAATAMASLQAYFSFTMGITCGIPSVTLLGTVADWKLLREKVDHLLEFEVPGNPEGTVMELWVGYLRKACDGLVESAEHPGSSETLEFWDKVLSHHRVGSGMNYITGWLSAFTCFGSDGKFIGKRKSEGAEFPKIDEMNICHNVVSCPVKVDDNGVEHNGTLFVGQVAFEAKQGGGEKYPTIHPRNDWSIAVAAKA